MKKLKNIEGPAREAAHQGVKALMIDRGEIIDRLHKTVRRRLWRPLGMQVKDETLFGEDRNDEKA